MALLSLQICSVLNLENTERTNILSLNEHGRLLFNHYRKHTSTVSYTTIVLGTALLILLTPWCSELAITEYPLCTHNQAAENVKRNDSLSVNVSIYLMVDLRCLAQMWNSIGETVNTEAIYQMCEWSLDLQLFTTASLRSKQFTSIFIYPLVKLPYTETGIRAGQRNGHDCALNIDVCRCPWFEWHWVAYRCTTTTTSPVRQCPSA